MLRYKAQFVFINILLKDSLKVVSNSLLSTSSCQLSLEFLRMLSMWSKLILPGYNSGLYFLSSYEDWSSINPLYSDLQV